MVNLDREEPYFRKVKNLHVRTLKDTSTSDVTSPQEVNQRLSKDEEAFGVESVLNDLAWDQFAASDRFFGVTSDFDEDQYTTLDRNTPDFKERERKAQQIADKILASATNNVHVAEERGFFVNDDIGDERYASILQDTNLLEDRTRAATSAYTKPSLPAKKQSSRKKSGKRKK